MNDRELIASLVKSLAWPVTVLIVLLVFRKPVAAFLQRLKRIKYGEFEAEAEAEVRAIERIISERPIPVPVPEAIAPSPVLQYYRTVAAFSPRAAVMEAWATFEATAQAAAIKRQILKPNEPFVFPAIFDKLLNAGFLQPNEVAALVRARELRNRVVHAPGQEIGADTALRYAALLQGIAERLKTPRDVDS